MSRQNKSAITSKRKLIFTVIILLVIAGAGFYLGTVYQKNRDVADAEAQKKAAQVAATPVIGKVADVSDKKISVKLTKTNETKSYEINSNTQILSNSGKKASTNDIKKDQSIILVTEVGKPNVARRISVAALPSITKSSDDGN